MRVFGENPYENLDVTPKVALIADKDETNNSFTVRETLRQKRFDSENATLQDLFIELTRGGELMMKENMTLRVFRDLFRRMGIIARRIPVKC